MNIPSIHSCTKLSAENAALRKKVHQLKQAKADVEEKLSVLLEKNKVESLLKSFCTTRDSSVQTEARPWTSRTACGFQPARAEPKLLEADLDKTNKMIHMHSQVLRRYEKEVKQNMAYTETISQLTLKLAAVEKQIKEEQDKRLLLERELWTLKRTSKCSKQKVSAGSSGDDAVLRELLEEKNRLSKENKKLKCELKGLDKDFFDEVEDLKFALQQSATLNKEYEKTLRMLCQQFGLAYPNLQQILHAS